MGSRSDRDVVPSPTEWNPPPGLPCQAHHQRLDSHSDRIAKLEGKADTADARLGQGDVSFAEMRKDIHALTQAVMTQTASIRWVGFIIVGAVLYAMLGQVLHPAPTSSPVAVVKP